MSRYGSNRGSDRKNLVTQGLVTFNCGDGKGIQQHRQQQAASGTLAVLAPYTMSHESMDGHHIKPFELMMGYKDMSKVTQRYANNHVSRSMNNLTLEPFTTFNGIEKKTETDFRNTLLPIGFAADYHVYGDPAQMDVGVAAIVAGSFTTTNTGLQHWTPGQLIKWSPPPMTAAKLDANDDALKDFKQKREEIGAVSASEPLDRFPAVLEPLDFTRDIKKLVQTKLEQAKKDLLKRDGKSLQEVPDSDAIKCLRLKYAADLRTMYVMAGMGDATTLDVNRTNIYSALDATTSDADLIKAVDVYLEYYNAGGAFNKPLLLNGPADTFHFETQQIHEVMSQVVAKSIGFSLPGGGGEVVV